MRCWGYNGLGTLGLGFGFFDNIGDNELPSSVDPVALGGPVIDLAVGFYHACALLEGGDVRCWGFNQYGVLGQGDLNHIGDDEHPDAVDVLSLGDVPAVDLSAGAYHTCALLEDGDVRCWGQGHWGQLGLGVPENIGDDELPSSVTAIDIGAAVDEVACAFENTCVRIGHEVKCWGVSNSGVNGNGLPLTLGDDELPSSLDAIDLGFDATALSTGNIGFHMCALSGSALRCWGQNSRGELGLGHDDTIGDTELPSSQGEVSYL